MARNRVKEEKTIEMKTLYLTIVALFIAFGSAFAESASEALNKAAAVITSAKGITAYYRLSADGGAADSGTIYFSGRKYAIYGKTQSTVFNGTTQWTITPDVKEITIYDPTPDEVLASNPLEIIKSWSANFNASKLKSEAGTVKVMLKPKRKDSALKSVTVTLNSTSWIPTEMGITSSDGSTGSFKLSDVRLNANIPDSRFVINQNSYPGYEFIDMR